jgi:hypothetical protein
MVWATFMPNFSQTRLVTLLTFFQTKKNYYNHFIKPMKLVRELRLFLLQVSIRPSSVSAVKFADNNLSSNFKALE